MGTEEPLLDVPPELEAWFNQTLLSPSSPPSRPGRRGGRRVDATDPEWDERLVRCWRLQSCGSCLSSDARCGWCPYALAQSSTCIPLPSASDIPLRWAPLAPLKHAHICPFDPERFELRTKSFGRESCNVSTTTLLTAIVSFFCGIAALFVLFGLGWVVAWLIRAGRRAKNGIEVVVMEGGWPGEIWREERIWVRKKGWWRQRGDGEEGERTALLQG